jgi:hypothetical protein
VEESTSILLSDANAQSELHIQQPLYSNSHLSKLVETENKLNQVFEEYTGRIESFMMMLDSLKEGVFLINKAGEVCYANEPGNVFMKDFGSTLPDSLSYRSLPQEEIITVNISNQPDIQVRASNFLWNGEQCNLFILEKKEMVKPEVILSGPVTDNGPFASLMNYLNQIAEHEANGRSGEAAGCAELAGKTLVQSEKVLGDLKTYIRLTNYKPPVTQISMQMIAGDVLKWKGPEIEDAEIEISISELPEATGDKDLITNLLKHLISNAVKFRNKGRKAIIDIGHNKSEGQVIFCVRDNGIGISKKHHEEVFNLFFSLNDRVEYPGNGMGLAICKKIVEMHGGKIWVESLPGHGSNFYFKLNAK